MVKDLTPPPPDDNPDFRTPVKQLNIRNNRYNLFFVIYALLFIYLLGGLSYRQLMQSSKYEKRGEQQSQRRVLQPGPRGDIYDRNGKLLVGSRPRFSAVVYLDILRSEFRKAYIAKVREAKKERERLEELGQELPSMNRYQLRLESRVEVLQKYLDQVNEIIGRDEEVDMREMARHFSQRLLLPLTLLNDLTPREYAQIIEQLPVNSPIQIYTDSARFYPYRSAASHTLGYVGRTNEIAPDDIPDDHLTTFTHEGKVGKAGLEKQFNEKLSGTTGEKVWLVDPVGYQFDEPLVEKSPTRGRSIYTSLDIDLQRTAESALEDKTGAVVALDVKTGEILVLASKPDYDLNDLSPSIPRTVYNDIQERGAWLNRAIQGRYPPGSTFKVLTSIAGMRIGELDPLEKIWCESYYTIGRRNFPEHGNSSFGWVDLPFALQVSSNVYYYQKSLDIGVDAIAAEAKSFGLGARTGIELPYENRGHVPDPEWKRERLLEPWVSGDTANMSIGQGYLITTPLQMACFTASLARGETQTKPTLIHQPGINPNTINHGGEPIDLARGDFQNLISGMEKAAGPGGTAKYIRIPGVRIAAKTGSAEFRSGGQDLTIAWTIAFAPIENPQIAIAVMVEGTDPDDNYYGGSTAAPIARAVFKHYFSGQ